MDFGEFHGHAVGILSGLLERSVMGVWPIHDPFHLIEKHEVMPFYFGLFILLKLLRLPILPSIHGGGEIGS